MYDWDFSASEYLANSLTSDKPTVDCTKCMAQINALTQRITTLEENIQTLMKANTANLSVSSPQAPRRPTTLAVTPSRPLSSESSSDQSPLVHQDDTENDDNLMYINLLPGYGAKITVPQLDTCLRKSKGSGTALARLLATVYFDEKTLAESSVRGTKSKPALDSTIIEAIIKYVWEKRKCPEKDVVQAINQKCSDLRTGHKHLCKK